MFVGKWGDTKYRDSKYENWVRISQKDDGERINLAIVRLKDEDDFFDNKIFKFVEVLNGVGALDPGFYKLIKYGTADDTKIKLIRDGYSHGLADLMLERYPETVRATFGGEIEVSPRLVNMMINLTLNVGKRTANRLARLSRMPPMSQQRCNLTRPLRRQVRQHILQVGIRIVPFVPGRLDQTHGRSGAFAAA